MSLEVSLEVSLEASHTNHLNEVGMEIKLSEMDADFRKLKSLLRIRPRPNCDCCGCCLLVDCWEVREGKLSQDAQVKGFYCPSPPAHPPNGHVKVKVKVKEDPSQLLHPTISI